MSSDTSHSKLVKPAVSALNTMTVSMNNSAADSITAADAFIAELRRLKEIAVDECQKSGV